MSRVLEAEPRLGPKYKGLINMRCIKCGAQMMERGEIGNYYYECINIECNHVTKMVKCPTCGRDMPLSTLKSGIEDKEKPPFRAVCKVLI